MIRLQHHDGVSVMGKWITNVMVIMLLGIPMLGWPQSKEKMPREEILKFLAEQAQAYKVINDPTDMLTSQMLFKEPADYEGKVVMLLSERVREFGFPPPHHNPVDNPNFRETKTEYVFTAYGVKKTSKVAKFGHWFALIGAWRKAPRPNEASRHITEALGSMDVYKICSVLMDDAQQKGLVRCETLKKPFSE